MKPAPWTREELLSAFEERDGKLYWRRSGPGRVSGDLAGSLDAQGYWRIRFNYFDKKLHHVIWFLHTGEWPQSDLDHKDRDRSNNRFENLRLATGSQNSGNTAKRSNSRPYKGVKQVESGRYRVRYAGTFDTAEEAARAREARDFAKYGEFTYFDSPTEAANA